MRKGQTYVKPKDKTTHLGVTVRQEQRDWVKNSSIVADMNESEFMRSILDQAMKTADPLGLEYKKGQGKP